MSRRYCSVYGCLESSYRNPELSFFNIPKDAETKSTPVPRSTSFSARPSKSSLKSHNRTIGTGTRNTTKHDVASSTKLRSQDDPTPAHLKYGTFRRSSKTRRTSQYRDSPTQPDQNVSPTRHGRDRSIVVVPTSRRSRDKSILVAQSSMIKLKIPSPNKEQLFTKNTGCPVIEPALPPPRPATRHVRLSQTDPIHLDIKPKRSHMLWC